MSSHIHISLPLPYQLVAHYIDVIDYGPSKCPINKMVSSQDHQTVSWVPDGLAENSLTEFFLKLINFPFGHCKTVHCPSSKISLHCQTAYWV